MSFEQKYAQVDLNDIQRDREERTDELDVDFGGGEEEDDS
jgi:hypothetical protein